MISILSCNSHIALQSNSGPIKSDLCFSCTDTQGISFIPDANWSDTSSSTSLRFGKINSSEMGVLGYGYGNKAITAEWPGDFDKIVKSQTGYRGVTVRSLSGESVDFIHVKGLDSGSIYLEDTSLVVIQFKDTTFTFKLIPSDPFRQLFMHGSSSSQEVLINNQPRSGAFYK